MISISQAPIYPREILKTAFTYLANDSTGCTTFQDEISNYLNCKYVSLTSSGFSGLYTILKACNLKKGDEVIVPAYTCEDIPRLVNEMGFKLKFVDIEPHTYNINPEDLCDKISSNTRVVIAAHMFGYPCSIDEITEISHDNRALVIEDACQSFGAELDGKKVGTFGDAGLFSLNMGKPITTIHGGIICTRDRELSYKVSAINDTYRKYGVPHQIKTFAYMIGYSLCNVNFFYSLVYRMMGNKNLGETRSTTYSEIQRLMYKYTEFQATMGLQQLSKLDAYNDVRIKNASYLMENLNPNGLLFPEVSKRIKPTFSRLPIYFENMDEESRKNLMDKFIVSGTEVTPYIKASLPHIFNEKTPNYPVAEKMANKTLTIPTHPNLNKRDLDKIIDILDNWPHL